MAGPRRSAMSPDGLVKQFPNRFAEHTSRSRHRLEAGHVPRGGRTPFRTEVRNATPRY